MAAAQASLYQIDFAGSANDKVGVVGSHQTVLPHIVDDGKCMLTLIDLQETLHFAIHIKELDERLLKATSARRIPLALIDGLMLCSAHRLRYPQVTSQPQQADTTAKVQN